MERKCICGYVHEAGIDESGFYQDFLQGDEPFKTIKGDFKICRTSIWGEEIEVGLFGCPKCGTIKFEREW